MYQRGHVQHSKRKNEMYVLILTFAIVPHIFYPATVPNSAKYKYMCLNPLCNPLSIFKFG